MTDRRHFVVSAEALCDLEQRLQEPLFLGVPLGSTLNDVLVTEFLLGNRTWSLQTVLKDTARWGYHTIHRIGGGVPVPFEPGRYLLTWLDERASLRDLVLPVIAALGPERCTVIGATRSMREELPPETQFLTLGDAPAGDRTLWSRAYLQDVGPRFRRLSRALADCGIPKRVLPRLMDQLLMASLRLVSSGALLRQLQPTAILTEYDRNASSAPLILAGRLQHTPTLTMVHGAIDRSSSFGWTPIADYVLCWGEAQAEYFAAHGAVLDHIVITGRQSISRETAADRTEARARVGLDAKLPLVLLATSPVNPSWRHTLARAFCEGMRQLPSVAGVVRLHPSEHLGFYREEIEAYPQVRFLENRAWSLDESLAASDIVVVHSSTFAVDAFIKRKPVIELDVLPDRMHGAEYAAQAGCPVAASSPELGASVQRLLDDVFYREQCREGAERYVARYCSYFGSDAAEHVAAFVRQVAYQASDA